MKTSEKIFEELTRQRFADWYTSGRFDSYITGEYPKGHEDHVSKEEILKDIREMFNCR
jgi:hypothetical protein